MKTIKNLMVRWLFCRNSSAEYQNIVNEM